MSAEPVRKVRGSMRTLACGPCAGQGGDTESGAAHATRGSVASPAELATALRAEVERWRARR